MVFRIQRNRGLFRNPNIKDDRIHNFSHCFFLRPHRQKVGNVLEISKSLNKVKAYQAKGQIEWPYTSFKRPIHLYANNDDLQKRPCNHKQLFSKISTEHAEIMVSFFPYSMYISILILVHFSMINIVFGLFSQ